MMPCVGTCEHCGAKDVALVGLRATGSQSAYRANTPACSWCFHTDHGVVIDWEDDETTTTYQPDVLAKSLRESKP